MGSVRQGRAKGAFRLSRARRLPGYADLGVYQLDGGSTLGLLDFRGIGLNFWAIELESSAFHRLYGSAPRYVVGAGVDVRAPAAGIAPNRRNRPRLGRTSKDTRPGPPARGCASAARASAAR